MLARNTYKKINIGIRDFYIYYTMNAKHKVVSLEVFCSIFGEFNKFIANEIVTGKKTTLPRKLGYIRVEGKEVYPRISEDGSITSVFIDWKSTKELRENSEDARKKRKIVYHVDRYLFKTRWFKGEMFPTLRNLYKFKLTYTNNKALVKNIKEHPEYFKIN